MRNASTAAGCATRVRRSSSKVHPPQVRSILPISASGVVPKASAFRSTSGRRPVRSSAAVKPRRSPKGRSPETSEKLLTAAARSSPMASPVMRQNRRPLPRFFTIVRKPSRKRPTSVRPSSGAFRRGASMPSMRSTTPREASKNARHRASGSIGSAAVANPAGANACRRSSSAADAKVPAFQGFGRWIAERSITTTRHDSWRQQPSARRPRTASGPPRHMAAKVETRRLFPKPAGRRKIRKSPTSASWAITSVLSTKHRPSSRMARKPSVLRGGSMTFRGGSFAVMAFAPSFP